MHPRHRPFDRIPVLQLPDSADGRSTPLLRGRGPHLFVLTSPSDSPQSGPFLESLEAASDSLGEWGALLVVIASGSLEEARALRTSIPRPFELLADPELRFSARTGLHAPALAIADEWGEIYFVHQPDGEHPFPTVAEVEEWLRFIAVQCPECEASEGLWRDL